MISLLVRWTQERQLQLLHLSRKSKKRQPNGRDRRKSQSHHRVVVVVAATRILPPLPHRLPHHLRPHRRHLPILQVRAAVVEVPVTVAAVAVVVVAVAVVVAALVLPRHRILLSTRQQQELLARREDLTQMGNRANNLLEDVVQNLCSAVKDRAMKDYSVAVTPISIHLADSHFVHYVANAHDEFHLRIGTK